MVGEQVLDVVYDGECPFCSRYATLLQLREKGISVRLHDARTETTFVTFPEARHFDLDNGMLARWNGRWHHGADATQLISGLSRTAPMSVILRNPQLSALLYPLLRSGRNITLRVLGRRRISENRDMEALR